MIREIIIDNLNPDPTENLDPEDPGYRRNTRLTMTLTSPENSGLIVMDVQGLGPGKSTMSMRDNALLSGSSFNSAKIPTRNIVLSLRVNDTEDVETIRVNKVYDRIPIMSRVKVLVKTTATTYFIYGYVESVEPAIFTQYSGFTISILCPDPFFRIGNEEGSGTISGTSEEVTGWFQFPIGDDLGEDSFEFGERFFQSSDFQIELNGTVEVGPTFIIKAVGGTVEDPTIYFPDPDNVLVDKTFSILFNADLPALDDGDYLTIVCKKGEKSVIKYDADAVGDKYINYIGTVELDSSWPILQPGLNTFSYTAKSGGSYMQVEYTYEKLYIGV